MQPPSLHIYRSTASLMRLTHTSAKVQNIHTIKQAKKTTLTHKSNLSRWWCSSFTFRARPRRPPIKTDRHTDRHLLENYPYLQAISNKRKLPRMRIPSHRPPSGVPFPSFSLAHCSKLYSGLIRVRLLKLAATHRHTWWCWWWLIPPLRSTWLIVPRLGPSWALRRLLLRTRSPVTTPGCVVLHQLCGLLPVRFCAVVVAAVAPVVCWVGVAAAAAAAAATVAAYRAM